MSTAFLGWLLDGALSAALLAPLALALERACARRPAVGHLAWTLVLASLVLPPLPRLAGRADPAAAAPPPLLITTDAAALDHGPLDEAMLWMTRTFGGRWSSWLVLLLLVPWGANALVAGARELRRVRALRRLLVQAAPAPGRVRRLVRAVAARVGTRAPRVLVAEGASAPFVCGPLVAWGTGGGRRATLVLPPGLGGPALPAIVAHELAHLRRRDPSLAWLELLAGALHAWNPLFHLARRRARRCAELACDALTLRAVPGRRLPYAEALLRVAAGAPHAAPVCGGLGSHGAELELRLQRLVEPPGRTAASAGRLSAAVWLGALPLVLAPGFLPPTLELLPDYPAVTSADEMLVSLEAASWEELLERARVQAQAQPENGEARRHMGVALLALGRPREAAEAFGAQLLIGWRPEVAAYNLACAEVAAGDVEAALDALEHAFELGFASPEALRADPDLEPLRSSPRFQALLARAGG